MWKRIPAFAFCAMASLALARTEWQLIELPTLGGANTIPTEINNAGEVAGTSNTAVAGESHAFIWSGGVMRDLGRVGASSQGQAINHHGVVVGSRGPTTGGDVTAWKNGVAQSLGFVGVPFAVNKHGMVAGFQRHADFSVTGVVWNDGVLFELPGLTARGGTPVAINDHGVMAGFADTPSLNRHAVIWQRGSIRDLGTLGGFFSSAVDVNNHGVVVGSSGTADFRQEVFVWEDGVMRSLFPTRAGQGAHPSAINNRGDIVGQISSNRIEGFLFSDGALTMVMDLLPPAERARWLNLVPQDINDRGWMTGFGVRAGGDGSLRGFVLKPGG